MTAYLVPRSIYGDLGALRRNTRLAVDDPRIVNNPRAVEDLVKRKLLVKLSEDEASPPDPKVKAKGRKRVADAE